jgi:hypothetical protein
MSKRPGETYLGDAVYASFDGWQICLRTGDGNNQVIYLEPGVLNALSDFVAKIRQRTEDVGDGENLDA